MSRKPYQDPAPSEDVFAAIKKRWTVIGVCLFLGLLTMGVFGRTVWYPFIPYDDNAYVYDNPEVARGLSLRGIGWAFTHSQLYLWTPLTTISHMLDCQIYGVKNPAGHHLTNVLLHIATVIALFLVLRQATGALWRSAFVAAVFAIHPLRAESVAWVAERKDVLSGLFFMLALGAYVFYIRNRSVARYAALMLLFALGLLAKQMVVTLPCVLLLLDYWPLKRFAQAGGLPGVRAGAPVFLRLAVEKLPLFALSILSCIQSFWERKPEPGTVAPGLQHPLLPRIGNSLVSYVVYIGKFFFPVNLSAFHPFPPEVPVWQALAAFAALVGVTAGVFACRKKHPEFLTGWFWYVGMLAPVIGFIPLGKEGRADRYTYLPEIGLCIIVAWGVASLAAAWPGRRWILGGLSALVLAILAWLARIQASYWRSGVTLSKHALACAPDNAMALNYLGYALLVENQDEGGAAAEFRKAIALMPNYAEPENNLGIVLLQQGDVDGAIAHFNRALELDPWHVEARSNLAIALIQKGLLDEAIKQLDIVLQLKPGRPDAHGDLGNALLKKGDVDGAIVEFKRALAIDPGYADGHANLGNALLEKGEARGAIAEYRKALQLNPQNVAVQLSMARVLATCPDAALRDGNKAVVLASQAAELAGEDDPKVLDILAAAYAEAGRFPEAVETALRARELATARGNTKLANELDARLALYRTNTPLRLPPAQPPGQ